MSHFLYKWILYALASVFVCISWQETDYVKNPAAQIKHDHGELFCPIHIKYKRESIVCIAASTRTKSGPQFRWTDCHLSSVFRISALTVCIASLNLNDRWRSNPSFSRDDPTICECGRPFYHRDHGRTGDVPWTMERNTVPICRAPNGKLTNGGKVLTNFTLKVCSSPRLLVRSSGLGHTREQSRTDSLRALESAEASFDYVDSRRNSICHPFRSTRVHFHQQYHRCCSLIR